MSFRCDVRFTQPAQPVDATRALNLSAGVSNCKGLKWPFVELTSHFVQIGLRMHRQVGALRKVLSQQTIGVLIRAALPWALRIAKINVDVCRQREASMVRKFLTPVPGQRLI